MVNCPGTWTVACSYSGIFAPDSTTVSGYENDDPFFRKDGSQWELASAYDGRVMYPNWVGANSATPTLTSKTFVKTDPNCQSPVKKYDCINGQCIVSTKYNTPGQYQSLNDCQAVCGNGATCGTGKQCVDPTTFCPDGKVCIEQGEYNSIQTLISQINSEVCG